MSKLLIVESPAKAKTIGKYLGTEFVVKSSVGHVRDLPKKGLNIKIAPVRDDGWTFQPTYEVTADKKKVVEELRKAAKAADEIFLAPDPDREGEAIAWHLDEVLRRETAGKRVMRVTYNEITKSAVQNAVAHPRGIDHNLVDAQQARRILDRLVGFKVSPLLWKYLNYGYTLSAGRVQSVALRLLVEREAEIDAFTPVPYWILGVEAYKDAPANAFTAKLARLDGIKPDVKNAEQAAMLVDDLDGACLKVASVKTTPKTRHAFPPFTTSTLQQSASSACGFTPSRTMSIAQKLYEEGLITYMRTDSVNVAQVARAAAKAFITAEYGPEYHQDNYFKGKTNAQEAHEAIRPTDVANRPGGLKLDAQSAKLYNLIWCRFVASMMADARLSQRTVTLEAKKEGLRHAYAFTASVTAVEFEGFLKVMGTSLVKKRAAEDGDEETDEVGRLPPLAEGDELKAARWLCDRKETKPPSRYSEASLVKALEENGVGRPSTYAQTIEVLVGRKYATRESRQLVPTGRGKDVSNWLSNRLNALFNVGYTAEMEAELDKVEEGAENGDGMLSGFYGHFTKWLKDAEDPPPPPERFRELLALFDAVVEWNPPRTIGKRTYDDRVFVDSLREQLAAGEKPLSERQLQALAKLAAAYADRIPDGSARLASLGYGSEVDRQRNAPPEELVKWCFRTVDRIPGMMRNAFVKSLREQVDRGRQLSEKQFAILARAIGENAGGLEDVDEVRAKLLPYVPNGFAAVSVDPSTPELLALADSISEWKPPVKRGRRTYDDKEFVSSLKDQFTRRRSLSPRQLAALRRVLAAYRTQIPAFEEAADRLGLREIAAVKPRASAAADAREDARAERKAGRVRR